MDCIFEYEWGKLGKRNSKILGGYVTENLFSELFIQKNKIPYTKEWWFSKTIDRKIFWFVEKNELTPLDLKIKDILQKWGYECYQLYFIGDSWEILSLGTGNQWNVEQFVEEHKIVKVNKKNNKSDLSDCTADEINQLKRCVEYYKKYNLLEVIKKSIDIEDSFLNKYFYTSNIDLFIDMKEWNVEEPVCLEIKFKDEFMIGDRGYFGMDCYQLDQEYRILEEAGMQIFNIILYNDSRNKYRKTTTNIFDYLDQATILKWKYVKVSKQNKYKKYSMNSKKTSFTGMKDRKRSVYCIPVETVHDLLEIEEITKEPMENFKNSYQVRCPECGGELRERNGKYGEFWGCRNYPRCKYTRNFFD